MHGLSEGRLLFRRDWAPGLATIAVDAEVEAFLPGQFVNLGLERGGEIERRSYSIASPPGATLEFLVTEVAVGLLTPRLFGLKVGDRLFVERKPQGFFTLSWVPAARDLWLVATGTGLGPFLAILKSDEAWRRFERLILVHGARESGHLAHRDELLALAKERGKLTSVHVVSRDPSAVGVLHGRVTSSLADGSLERAAGLAFHPEHSHVMLCGNPAMIDDMMAALAERGLRRHRVRNPGHITVEKYW